MVAYSFKERFVAPIVAGTKAQTIRKYRRRHARPGEEVQLYTGLRTRYCRLIGRATCSHVAQIKLVLTPPQCESVSVRPLSREWLGGFDGFARADGFENWEDLKAFWRQAHPGVDTFEGVLICWKDFRRAD